MSNAAHRGDDDIAFYAADIGETREIAATSAADIQLPDVDGPLTPGRWLIQIFGANNNAKIWIGFGKFEVGVLLPSPVGAGKQRIPLSPRTIIAVETNVVKGYSDQCVARTTLGTATVTLTRISRGSTTGK